MVSERPTVTGRRPRLDQTLTRSKLADSEEEAGLVPGLLEAVAGPALLLGVAGWRQYRCVGINQRARALLVELGLELRLGELLGRDEPRDSCSQADAPWEHLIECCETALERGVAYRPSAEQAAGVSVTVDSAIPLLGGAGEAGHVLCTLAADRRAGAARAPGEADDTYRRSFELSPAALLVIELSTQRFLDVNEASCRLFGHPREQFVGRTGLELQLWHDCSDREDFYRRLLETGAVRDLEVVIRTRRDTRLSALLSAEIFESGGEEFAVASFYDVTSRRHTERVQRQLEAHLRQAHRLEALGTLAAGIAHDFNNLLTVFSVVSDMIELDLRAPEELSLHLKELRSATARAQALTRQILTAGRSRAPERRRVDLCSVVRDALGMLSRAAPERITFCAHLLESPLHVHADGDQLHQVLMNLGTNAVHALRSQGGVIEVTVEQRHADPALLTRLPGLRLGSYAVLVVQDHGEGMAEETVARVFEPFFTTKARGEGTGLGLAVVHGIVQEHGGALEVISKLGEGTCVTVYLPLDCGEEAHPSEASVRGVLRGHGEHILLVEDDVSVAHGLAGLLARIGYRVTTCVDSREALSRFAAEPEDFELVISDLALPAMTGDQLAAELHRLRPSLPIVLMSGHCEGWAAEGAKRLGVWAWLQKPVELEALSVCLARGIEAGQGSGGAHGRVCAPFAAGAP